MQNPKMSDQAWAAVCAIASTRMNERSTAPEVQKAFLEGIAIWVASCFLQEDHPSVVNVHVAGKGSFEVVARTGEGLAWSVDVRVLPEPDASTGE